MVMANGLMAEPYANSQTTANVEHGRTTRGPVPIESDGKGVVVRLELPWTVLLKNENLTF